MRLNVAETHRHSLSTAPNRTTLSRHADLGTLGQPGCRVVPAWNLEGGLEILWPTNAGAVMRVAGEVVAETALLKVESDGADAPARLCSRTGAEGRVTEVWSLDNPSLDVQVEYSPEPSQSAVRVRLASVNRSSRKAAACVALELRLKQSVDRALLFDFTKAPYLEFAYGRNGLLAASFTAEKDVNFQHGLYGYPNRRSLYNGWGTVELCNPPEAKDAMSSTLYLPIVSLFNEAQGGVVAWCDPCSPFGFDGNRDRLRLQHTFYLPAGEGTIDDGFEPGDGTGPWPYLLYLSYSSKPTWDELYARKYMPTSPDLRAGQKSRFKPGILGCVRTTEQSLPIERRLGMKINTALTGGLSVSYSSPDWNPRSEIEWAKSNGITYCALDGTIGMTIQVEKSQGIPSREPQWVTERYESSLIKDRSGRTQWCWEGSFANPSPRFPFGRDRVEALKELFKLPVSGFWVDLFLTPGGSDWAHPVDAMPFYPLQRAYYEYLSAVANESRRRGLKLFAINAPWPSCLVGKYADCMTFDAYVSLSLMMRTYGELTGVSTHLLADFMGDTPPEKTPAMVKKIISEAMAYGVINSPYGQIRFLLPDNQRLNDGQKEEVLAAYERHYRLAYKIGRARLVKGTTSDGHPGPFLYYRAE
ncbi:MAG: hypothetical protein M1608_15970, partial [Candidatus Omnitrophica bacterium]|nr:hypothetical protein [Candidatus Omnitrophota bacterium]